MWKLFALAVLCAFAVKNCQSGLSNPCPERFKYEVTDTPGRWVGTLNLLTEYKLYGTWIRLFFDSPIKGVEVAGKLLDPIVSTEPDTTILLKDWNLVLNKGVPTPVKIAVLYDGHKLPSLNNLLEVVTKEVPTEILIKNRDLVLKKGVPTEVKITVLYDEKAPNLVGYRLNARSICPESDE